ncbi:hypothetical protein [Mesobacillus jeotgali]|uniref:hypothetical protein n=1 Tax=Mesobacillus jeotgali TaxID=129985 RepID=UPI0009A80C64|nr:hypothetical protein [Mesobacillus jeotgali]
MKKLLRFLLIVVILAAVAMMKPEEEDFAEWMEDTYEIKCLDEICDTFQVETDGEAVTMQMVHGGYSPGIFVAQMHKTYKSNEDPSYFLELEVSGFLGNRTIEEETVKKIAKR